MEYKIEHFSPLMGSMEYVILLVCMVGIVVALLIWRQKIMGMGGFAKGAFSFIKSDKADEIKIVSHKAVDVKNRIVVVECEGYRYIILVGVHHSLLLDKFLIQETTKKFQDFLKEQGNESS